MRQMGLKAYRFSIAWSRVQPDGKGPFNEKGLSFYDALVDALIEEGIEPFITLCHYDIPQALEDQGGWVNRDTCDRFADYAATMSRRFGSRVTHWMTLNEPICIANGHYAETIGRSPGRYTGCTPPVTGARESSSGTSRDQWEKQSWNSPLPLPYPPV